MNGISHKQAIQFIDRRIDGMLDDSQRSQLEEHLRSCDSCQSYAAGMDGLSAHLQNEFHRRWNAQPGPSQSVFEHVNTKASRLPIQNRIATGVKLFAGAVALIALMVAINFVVSQVKTITPVTSSTETVDHPVISENPLNPLLAFASDQDGDLDIYTMHADGSGLINITNNPGRDANPFWSPDGQHIAFEREQDGFTQVYLMDADGANVTQLTKDETQHFLPTNMHGESNPWSPDGRKLLFLQWESGVEGSSLYSLDMSSGNVVQLGSGNVQFNNLSWSPDGKYVGYVLNDSPTPDATFETGLYVIDSTGSNLIPINELVPEPDVIDSPAYHWSRDGRSIIFIAYRHLDEGKDQWIAYEAILDDHQLVERATSSTRMQDWWEGTSFISGDTTVLTWLRADGTFNTFEPLEVCDLTVEDSHGFYAKRSPNGSQVINTSCPNKDLWFYYANSDGSIIKPLMSSPIPAITVDNSVTSMTWSSDDRFIAITLVSPTKSSLYVLNVNEPAAQPQELVMSNIELYSIPSWQPVADENIAQEVPTPQPRFTATGLLAFTSDQNGNFEIYTMHADGGGLTNLTNNPALDIDPFWSPDGKRIAFTSGRDGSSQIYLMDADGSNVVQLTSGETSHKFARYIYPFSPWSPDGSKLLLLESPPGEEKWKLYVTDANGENKRPLVDEPNTYGAISWSPDGQHIALIADDLQNLGGDRIYVVDADGSDFRELTKSLQQSEQLSAYDYQWSPDSRSIFFVAFFQKTDPYWTAYEARLDDQSLIVHATTNDILYGWWNDIYLVNNFTASAPFEWVRSDGRTTTFNPHEKCQTVDLYMSGDSVVRSPNGNWLIAGHCSNSDTWLYWANPDGTIIKPIVDSPIPLVADQMSTISWSPNDQFITFTISASDLSDLYILNISEARNDRFIPPVKLSKSFGVSWQPVPNREVVEEAPTPELTPAVSEALPQIGTGVENGEWIAFTGTTMGPVSTDSTALTDSKDVYLIHPDGGGLVNLTNSPDYYSWPAWSPDGKHLLFVRSNGTVDILGKTEPTGFEVLVNTGMKIEVSAESLEKPFSYSWSPDSDQIAYIDNQAGNYDIYTIYADGGNDLQLKQLTNDPGQEFGFVWSPDGSQIAYQRTNGEQLSIMVMNADGSNQHEVARGQGEVWLRWSLDGHSIYASSVYIWPPESKNSILECEGCVPEPAIYLIDLDGPSVQQIYHDEDADLGWILYDTIQNGLYFMQVRFDRPSLGTWGTWRVWDGSSIRELPEMDPQQTCKTTTGNILHEHVSPNERFSIISDFCAGVFDFYLADREAGTPGQRLTHLIRLPPDTLGQGADEAYIPIQWSADGRWLVYENGSGVMYLLDIEKAVQDPEHALTPLMEPYTGADGQQYQSSETITISELVWQPMP